MLLSFISQEEWRALFGVKSEKMHVRVTFPKSLSLYLDFKIAQEIKEKVLCAHLN